MLQRVALQNFLAFRELDLEVAPLTLLSGANSAGKSSVLKALALMRQSSQGTGGADQLLLNGELLSLGAGRDVLHTDSIGHEGSKTPHIAIELDFVDEAGLKSSLLCRAEYGRELDALPLAASLEPLPADLRAGFQYLTADRVAPAVTYPKSLAAVNTRWLGVRGEHAANFVRVFGDETAVSEQLRHPESAGPTLQENLNAWLNEISPGTSFRVADIERTELVRIDFGRRGGFETDAVLATDPQRPTNVGFGMTFVLPVLVALLDSRPGDLLLIENPEGHLHPRAQTLIGRLCAQAAAAGAQVIVESHSDHVLNALRLAIKDQILAPDGVAVYYFARQPDELQPTVERIAVGVDGMVASWPAGFFDEMDRAIDKLLG